MADRMVRVTAIHKRADPNTKAISSSVLIVTILGLVAEADPAQIHIKAA